MNGLIIDDLEVRFGDIVALNGMSFSFEPGQMLGFLGPNGAGKTTTMRAILGLVSGSQRGELRWQGHAIDAAKRRIIGYMPEERGLYPRMKVLAQVTYFARLAGMDPAQARAAARRWLDVLGLADRYDSRVQELSHGNEQRVQLATALVHDPDLLVLDEPFSLLHLVGLDPEVYRDRYPTELSGGQQQRVGVARALGADPPVLLMDEPFGALDPITRSRLQDELLALQAGVRKTIVFVTHDIDEAVKLGDRIVLLADDGTLAQHASALDLLERPASEFVSSFIGQERSMLLLSVRGINLDRVVPTSGADHEAELPRVAHTARAREALAAIVASRTDRVLVVNDDGQPIGVLHLADAVH